MTKSYLFRVFNHLTLMAYLSLVFSVPTTRIYAVPPSSLLDSGGKAVNFTRAEEYFSEIYPGEILIPINLLGAVGKPGVYHIPKQTDLIRLLSLAGGTRADANLEDVSIKRRSGESERLFNINLKELVEQKTNAKPLNLEANDVVLVVPKEPMVSNNTLAVVGLTASLLGLIVSSLVIVNQLKK